MSSRCQTSMFGTSHSNTPKLQIRACCFTQQQHAHPAWSPERPCSCVEIGTLFYRQRTFHCCYQCQGNHVLCFWKQKDLDHQLWLHWIPLLLHSPNSSSYHVFRLQSTHKHEACNQKCHPVHQIQDPENDLVLDHQQRSVFN